MTTQTLSSGMVSSGKAKNITLWVLQVLVAALFIMAGGSKLAGVEMHVKTFEAIGIGQWFRYLTGAIEVGSGLLLFTPALSGVGALLLMGTMAGAVLTHLFIIGGSPAMPAVLFVISTIIAYGRKDKTLRLLGK